MNDNLISTLRGCASKPAPCNNCDLFTDDCCTDTLLRKAADVIEELTRFRERMDNIKAVQFVYHYGDNKTQEMVGYFDVREINEDEVLKLINTDRYNPRVTIMTRRQAELVFGFKWQKDDNKTELLS